VPLALPGVEAEHEVSCMCVYVSALRHNSRQAIVK
jgi:hypothetical protein